MKKLALLIGLFSATIERKNTLGETFIPEKVTEPMKTKTITPEGYNLTSKNYHQWAKTFKVSRQYSRFTKIPYCETIAN